MAQTIDQRMHSNDQSAARDGSVKGGECRRGKDTRQRSSDATTIGVTSSYESHTHRQLWQASTISGSSTIGCAYIAGMDVDHTPEAGSSEQRDVGASSPTAMDAGQCGRCRHVRIIRNGRSDFFLCQRSSDDDSFCRYPRLPVNDCPGYEQGL